MAFIEGIKPTEGYDRFEEITQVRNEKSAEIRDEKHKDAKEEHRDANNQIDFTI